MKQSTKKKFKRMVWIILSVIAVLLIAVLIFINQSRFGKTPSGERKQRVENSPNYKDGKFQNLSDTPQLTGEDGFVGSMYNFLFKKNKRVEPADAIPSIKTDLKILDRKEDILVWFGHSSYFIQIDGKRILVDPVLSGAASPVSFVNKPFKGSDIYRPSDIPEIDYLVISHDHWDHLDYNTIMELKPRIGKIICGLGVGEHFEYWGFDKNNTIELDWDQDSSLDTGFEISCLPARHFSGRGLSPNQSLWTSFLLQTPSMRIYIGGDSGYDTHFQKIGERFGEIDLAILENGQYDKDWKYIHMMPEELLTATKDLKAKRLLPVHNSKYALGNHSWDDPLIRITEANKVEKINLMTPKIGEIVNLKDSTQTFSNWWEGLN